MKRRIRLLVILIVVGVAGAAFAGRLITVDDDGPADFNTIQAAIDDANDGDVVVVQPGTYTGEGNRDISYNGKAIMVRSLDPNDPVVVATTVIDCQGSLSQPHRALRFDNSEGPDSVISGITIRNGYGHAEQVGYHFLSSGGAIYCRDASPTINRCRIIYNKVGHMGGGILCTRSNPRILNCTFDGNHAHHAGAICNEESNPILLRCTFNNNSVEEQGGAIGNLYGSSPTIRECSFTNNSARRGGAIRSYDEAAPCIANCLFSGNTAEYGSAIACDECDPVLTNSFFTGNSGGSTILNSRGILIVRNCTIAGNTSPAISNYYGGSLILTNSILWNKSYSPPGITLYEGSGATVSYCNIQKGMASISTFDNSWFNWGDGNIDEPPLFDAAGYHLSANSPCRDAGMPGDYLGQTDIDEQPRRADSRIDIGADEYSLAPAQAFLVHPTQIEVATELGDITMHSAPLLAIGRGGPSLECVISEECTWLSISDAPGRLDNSTFVFSVDVIIGAIPPMKPSCELRLSDRISTDRFVAVPVTVNLIQGGQLHIPGDFITIQSAIDSARDGDTIIIADGRYTGPGNYNVDFKGKCITLCSANGPENCIIDCERQSRAFKFESLEDANTVLAGLTITNGYENDDGGAIVCEQSSPTIRNCRLIHNSAIRGGAVRNYDSRPTFDNCTFSDNTARDGGGAMDNYNSRGGPISCSPIIINCMFSNNTTKYNGGGAIHNYETSITMISCLFEENKAELSDGGAVYDRGPKSTFKGCVFRGNTAQEKGGAIQVYNSSRPKMSNCTFIDNVAEKFGGAVCSERSSYPELSNCILWGNKALQGQALAAIRFVWGTSYTSWMKVSYCDIEGGYDHVYSEAGCRVDWGSGNIVDSPLFVDYLNDDYHLKSEAGRWDQNSDSWVQDGETSPCIDTGDPMSAIGHEPFPNGGIINMGAYGGTAEASKSWFGQPVCEAIIQGDINGDCKVDFKDCGIMVLHWLDER